MFYVIIIKSLIICCLAVEDWETDTDKPTEEFDHLCPGPPDLLDREVNSKKNCDGVCKKRGAFMRPDNNEIVCYSAIARGNVCNQFSAMVDDEIKTMCECGAVSEIHGSSATCKNLPHRINLVVGEKGSCKKACGKIKVFRTKREYKTNLIWCHHEKNTDIFQKVPLDGFVSGKLWSKSKYWQKCWCGVKNKSKLKPSTKIPIPSRDSKSVLLVEFDQKSEKMTVINHNPRIRIIDHPSPDYEKYNNIINEHFVKNLVIDHLGDITPKGVRSNFKRNPHEVLQQRDEYGRPIILHNNIASTSYQRQTENFQQPEIKNQRKRPFADGVEKTNGKKIISENYNSESTVTELSQLQQSIQSKVPKSAYNDSTKVTRNDNLHTQNVTKQNLDKEAELKEMPTSNHHPLQTKEQRNENYLHSQNDAKQNFHIEVKLKEMSTSKNQSLQPKELRNENLHYLNIAKQNLDKEAKLKEMSSKNVAKQNMDKEAKLKEMSSKNVAKQNMDEEAKLKEMSSKNVVKQNMDEEAKLKEMSSKNVAKQNMDEEAKLKQISASNNHHSLQCTPNPELTKDAGESGANKLRMFDLNKEPEDSCSGSNKLRMFDLNKESENSCSGTNKLRMFDLNKEPGNSDSVANKLRVFDLNKEPPIDEIKESTIFPERNITHFSPLKPIPQKPTIRSFTTMKNIESDVSRQLSQLQIGSLPSKRIPERLSAFRPTIAKNIESVVNGKLSQSENRKSDDKSQNLVSKKKDYVSAFKPFVSKV